MAEIVYADNYEEITGQKKPSVETKVVSAPKKTPKAATPVAEVK